ncbi:hypothetical protein [Nocardiopsis ansamitocini]|uniref:DUF7927 domain-containing protein n=1 Tax=Nocardiopsis ansamitocini TaxID=1670832 RepID=A0A9W6PA22_9ACTN|nr:hypothetical protein [Nocardiopsis ansamitocini]GLU49732.1 hypothetical protein Nans01_40830 [Nocardiopsis ansamitocini]
MPHRVRWPHIALAVLLALGAPPALVGKAGSALARETAVLSPKEAAGACDAARYDADHAIGGSARVDTTRSGCHAISSITGTVYEDRAFDGETSGDPGWEGVGVELYAGAGETPVATATTGADGYYGFLLSGDMTGRTYWVRVAAPSEQGRRAQQSWAAAGGRGTGVATASALCAGEYRSATGLCPKAETTTTDRDAVGPAFAAAQHITRVDFTGSGAVDNVDFAFGSPIRVVKTVDTVEAKVRGRVGYTLEITNTGPRERVAAVTDDLAGVLDDATFAGDAKAAAGTIVRTGTDLIWSGTLGPGESTTVTYSVTVNIPVSGDALLNGSVTSVGSNCSSGADTQECAATTTVTPPQPLLQITKTATSETVQAGRTLGYTITVVNDSGAAATGQQITDDLAEVLDDAVYNGDAKASSGTVGGTARTLSWTGDIAHGQSVTLTYSVTARSRATGDGVLSNTVVADRSNCVRGSRDMDCSTDTPVGPPSPPPQLTVGKTADTAKVAPGGTVTYTITIANTGQVAGVDQVVTDDLTGILDDAVYNGDAATSSGYVRVRGDTLTWDGDIAPGEKVTVTYSVTVNDRATGDGRLDGGVSAKNGKCDGECEAVTLVTAPCDCSGPPPDSRAVTARE